MVPVFGFLSGLQKSLGFWRQAALMLAWWAPVPIAKLAEANRGHPLYRPVMLVSFAAMVVFTLVRPATSSLRMGLIQGAIGWSRLFLIVFAGGFLSNLYDAGWVFSQASGLGRDSVICAAAVLFEAALTLWVERDVAKRGVVFD